MRSLQKKLLLYIVIIGVIPILVCSFFYYNIANGRVTDKLYGATHADLKQMDNRLSVKIDRVQNTLDIILDDAELLESLRNSVYTSPDENETLKKCLDGVYEKFARNERALRSVILFPVSGNAYVSGANIDDDPIRFVMHYDSIGDEAGVFSWLGLREAYNSKESRVIVAGTMLRDSVYIKDQAFLGSVYMVFDSRAFMDGTETTDGEYIDAVPEKAEPFSIYDSNAKLIYSNENGKLRNVFLQRPISSGIDGYGDDAGGFKISVDKTDYLVIYYTSPITGWKFVRPVECGKYYAELRYVKYTVILAFLLMVLAWYVCNYFLVNRITLPLRELTAAMESVEKDDFETELAVRSNDEIGVITKGFNAMVVHIRTLLSKIRYEEEKRRQNDILMLRYQMNPHFLYNTLSAIRFTAIMNKQMKIADMLLILGRFLRNAILTVNTSLDVKSEIANIRDYISLYQLRYNDSLKVEIFADSECENYKIPGMVCQPIIENSIMHGLDEKLNSGENAEIKVHIYENGDFLCVSVWDNGKGIPEKKVRALLLEESIDEISAKDRLHIGIYNTNKRIKMIFGNEYGLGLKSEQGKYTEVIIKLPKIKNGD